MRTAFAGTPPPRAARRPGHPIHHTGPFGPSGATRTCLFCEEIPRDACSARSEPPGAIQSPTQPPAPGALPSAPAMLMDVQACHMAKSVGISHRSPVLGGGAVAHGVSCAVDRAHLSAHLLPSRAHPCPMLPHFFPVSSSHHSQMSPGRYVGGSSKCAALRRRCIQVRRPCTVTAARSAHEKFQVRAT